MNATTFSTNKDFRKSVDIRKKFRRGKIERRIYLPPDDFTYGLPNTYIKSFRDLIYNVHGNCAEDEIRHEYDTFIKEKTYRKPKPTKVIPRFVSPMVEKMKNREIEKQNLTGYGGFYSSINGRSYTSREKKPLYKLKMFQDVNSKVAEEVKLFKTYYPYKKTKKVDNGIDKLINKVQKELKDENCKNNEIYNNYNTDIYCKK